MDNFTRILFLKPLWKDVEEVFRLVKKYTVYPLNATVPDSIFVPGGISCSNTCLSQVVFSFIRDESVFNPLNQSRAKVLYCTASPSHGALISGSTNGTLVLYCILGKSMSSSVVSFALLSVPWALLPECLWETLALQQSIKCAFHLPHFFFLLPSQWHWMSGSWRLWSRAKERWELLHFTCCCWVQGILGKWSEILQNFPVVLLREHSCTSGYQDRQRC